jgi:hypothetical protein
MRRQAYSADRRHPQFKGIAFITTWGEVLFASVPITHACRNPHCAGTIVWQLDDCWPG